ncbi:MAG: hypothetical protein Q4C45_12020, partial [Oscillospiraceae bacterium]|nr:hypothetical protein [Oscillospiraceae bacterium]
MAAKETTVIEPWALSAALEQGLNEYRFLYITAPTGWGKTTAVCRHFRARRHTYASLWDEDALERAERDDTALVILDDCQALFGRPERQDRLFDLLRKLPAGSRGVLLSRAPLPEWLLPLRLSGLMTTISDDVFALGPEDVARLTAAFGVALPQEDILRLQRESRGHPLAVKLACLKLAGGAPLTTETMRDVMEQMFSCLDKQLSDFWGGKAFRLVQSVSPFDSFTLDLARVVTGDNQVERTLDRLCRISSFIDADGGTYTIRYPRYRAYLAHKVETAWSRQERSALYANAGMYYQLTGDLPAALDCCAKDGNHAKVSELLAEHSRLNPGHGAYYQLRAYYRGLPEKEILTSPELMCGMSILCSLTFDVEGSEKWYGALRAYAGKLDRRACNYREVRGMVSYLDIALPHRGSVGIRELLPAVCDQFRAGKLCLPEFSVTSNLPSILRGGKDFSAWVPRDREAYRLLAKPVELLLGRMGVGLPDIALAESRYEKGEDISDAFLTLGARSMDIRQHGAPEVEFVLTALMAKCLCDRGDLDRAAEDLAVFRDRVEEQGQKQLLPNLDALLCRFALLRGGAYAHEWFVEQAPDERDFFIMERYRYLTKVRCYLQQGQYLPALALLGRLRDYFVKYDRTLDRIEALTLLAICRYRMEKADWKGHLTEAMELACRYGYVTVFAHEGAALLPLLREWAWPEQEPGPAQPEQQRA